MKAYSRIPLLAALALISNLAPRLLAQDWVRTGTNLGNERIRIAAAEFKPGVPGDRSSSPGWKPLGDDPQTPALKASFDATLYNDLASAGLFEIVSRSLSPQAAPGSPQEIILPEWSAAPASAAMVAFGSLSVAKGRLIVYGWLDDARNTANPQVLGKQYNEEASQEMARTVAHRFADEIILRLGGGINGVAETKIYFVSSRGGSKEIWVMDYDGQNQHPVTHLGTVSLSPRISPDNARIAFSSLDGRGWAIRMYSLELNRLVSFPAGTEGGSNLSPAWSGDGTKVAFSSSRSGDSEIWIADASGGNAHSITSLRGPNVAPTWNPRTNAQIAWVGGITGEPQIYTVDQDGANVQRMTDMGYAISPSWSPSGMFLTFSWNRKYGPGAPGGQDIYVMDISTKRWLQLTHDAGSNDFPSWAPDGRHIVFERSIGGHSQIWTMLADGTEQHQLTQTGNNFMPNWSWK
ncbi:MAG: translocation protein TolB [Terracidiphilus sp.]|jgi:TolB protein